MDDHLPDERYVAAFMEAFGGSDRVFKDVVGEPLLINDRLFRRADGSFKLDKDKQRHLYVRLLANAIQQPDEVWALLEPDKSSAGKYRIKRRYLKRWLTEEDGQAVHGFSAFEYGQGVWSGNTVFVPQRTRGGVKEPNRMPYMERQREGVLLYRRDDEEE